MLDQLSGYAIAAKRVEGRRTQRNRISIWITLMILAATSVLLAGVPVLGCMIPVMVALGFLIIMDGILLYFGAPRHAPTQAMVEDEMGWLFGADWRDVAGTQEFMLAQERIQRRGVRRAYFYVDLVTFFLINPALFLIVAATFKYSASGVLNCLVLFVIGWLLFLGAHATMAFPSRRQLARQEHHIGQAILTEMQRSTPGIGKRKDKPKHDVQYRIGEDGELVEVEDEFTFDDRDEKAKRSSLK